jgi:hypothetical protein
LNVRYLIAKFLSWTLRSIERTFFFLKTYLFKYVLNASRRKKIAKIHLKTERFLRKFFKESRIFLAIRRNRNAVTMALFLAVLLIPLASSVNLVGQLGFINKKLPVETLEGGIILKVDVIDGQFVNKGDVLALLDEPRLNSELTSQLNSAASKACKLERFKAIVDLSEFQNPAGLDLIPNQYLERYCIQEKKVALPKHSYIV